MPSDLTDGYSGDAAGHFRVRNLRMLLNRRETPIRGSLFQHKETGELWEETTIGDRDETYVVRPITLEEAERKFGPLKDVMDRQAGK